MTSCKLKFGVSFHANMSLEDIVAAWCHKVTPEIKAEYPEIDDAINTVKGVLDTIRLVRTLYKTALVIFETTKLLVEASAAVTAQQGSTYAAGLIGVNTQTLAFELLQTALSQVGVAVTASFGCSNDPEGFGPSSTNPESPWFSELDQAVMDAQGALEQDYCTDITNIF